eukprot:gnl/Chilomastix_caulleri/2399.p1 GENE.gnl/Chilomastix_caulleri/2399~~gnl/Chilomastix_caulleri/2399.p1  ORF type:complete len:274 (+),score=83.00 gnl/Chilomastix_caulleri/2399:150-971(+)
MINEFSEAIKSKGPKFIKEAKRRGNSEVYELKPNTCIRHNAKLTAFDKEEMRLCCPYCDDTREVIEAFDDAASDVNTSNTGTDRITETTFTDHSSTSRQTATVAGFLSEKTIKNPVIMSRANWATKQLSGYKSKLEGLNEKLVEAEGKYQKCHDLVTRQTMLSDAMHGAVKGDDENGNLLEELGVIAEGIHDEELCNCLKSGVDRIVHMFDTAKLQEELQHLKNEIETLKRERRETILIMRMLKAVALTKSWGSAPNSTKVAHEVLGHLGIMK